jgi:hypothetical protein
MRKIRNLPHRRFYLWGLHSATGGLQNSTVRGANPLASTVAGGMGERFKPPDL